MKDKVIDAFENCIAAQKCRDCPWESCDTMNHETVEIPHDLAYAVYERLLYLSLKVREPVRPALRGTGFVECAECPFADEDEKTCEDMKKQIDAAIDPYEKQKAYLEDLHKWIQAQKAHIEEMRKWLRELGKAVKWDEIHD